MAPRKVFFANGEYYHIFNHSIGKTPIFVRPKECSIFVACSKFYLQKQPPTKFSVYRKSPNSYKLNLNQKIVSIINYCLMPDHYHFILKQEQEDGIRYFIQKISNSYAHCYSLKHKLRGHLFEDKFKAVHIETEEQLIHLSRYIHLNPVTAYLCENPEDYPFSTYKIYLGKETTDFIDPMPVLYGFKSPESYRDFVLSQKDYQRSLNLIKHLSLE